MKEDLELASNENNEGLGDLGTWCNDHPILTFLLVGSAITAVVNIVTAFTKK
jgi:hypothetical protein